MVQVADCLPVLFAAPDGRAVAAAHAGWRGLAGGVVEATVAALCEAAGCGPGDLVAWLGACIGPSAFEVGEDVLEAFGAVPALDRARGSSRAAAASGSPTSRAGAGPAGRRRRRRIGGGGRCTVATRHGSSRTGATASPGAWPPPSGS